jgi:hypothetical protein
MMHDNNRDYAVSFLRDVIDAGFDDNSLRLIAEGIEKIRRGDAAFIEEVKQEMIYRDAYYIYMRSDHSKYMRSYVNMSFDQFKEAYNKYYFENNEQMTSDDMEAFEWMLVFREKIEFF